MDENRFSSEEDGDVCCLDNVSAIYGGNLSEVDTPENIIQGKIGE